MSDQDEEALLSELVVVTSGGAKVVHSPVAEQKKKQDQTTMKKQEQARLNSFSVRRETVIAKLQRIHDTMNRAGGVTVHHLETYLRLVDACYDEFNLIQNEIYSEFPDQREQQEVKFIDFEQAYEELRVEICTAVEDHRKKQIVPQLLPAPMPVPPQPPAINQTPGLPHVPLPSFDGTYERWFRFKQLFQDLMEKYPGLSDATKLHYLTQSLKGKAENAINDQILNENNFAAAWNVLIERFENKRTILDLHTNGIINLPKMKTESAAELRQLVDECDRHVEGLEFHDKKMVGMSENLVISLLTSKLDNVTLSHWENTIKHKEIPKYKETIQFLRSRCFVLERCEANAAKKPVEAGKQRTLVPSTKSTVRVHAAQQESEERCGICDDSHNVNKCSVFKQMSVSDRVAKVKEKQLCFNCLRRGHRVSQCKSRVCTISGCGKRHHTQLHFEENSVRQKPKGEEITDESKDPVAGQSAQSTTNVTCTSITATSQEISKKQVILSTAVVEVEDARGVCQRFRVLLDSGSQSNFLSEYALNVLRLKREAVRIPIAGINGERFTATHQTIAKVKSTHRDSAWVLEFLVVPQVTGILPGHRIDIRQWHFPPHLELADPRFHVPARVDMLIGADLFYDLLLMERVKTGENQPTLCNTELGWIVCGSYTSVQTPAVVAAFGQGEEKLDVEVRRFWEQEEVCGEPPITEENQQCVEHFARTHRRVNGRFVVRLPFRPSVEQLGDSRSLAEKRFLQLERRLDLHPELKEQYAAFIKEYVDLGHCEKLRENEDLEGGFYLPHHAVLKPSSTTTKLRVVFDASARSEGNLSLNDVLIAGPILQEPLVAIVMRSRKYRFVFKADVIKMFRQMWVCDLDTKYLKFYWRGDRSEKLETYVLKTVTYGTSCAPFCATACLKQLADDEERDFPIAAEVVRKDFYMDDVLSGADEIEEVQECQQQLIALLKRGGFDLHKWCANSAELLTNIPPKDREQPAKIEEHSSTEISKTLGLLWDPSRDVFLFDMQSQGEEKDFYTKRIVLSETAKIFDPLGLLEAVTITAKLFIQQLWAMCLTWDERLPAEQEAKWRQFRGELQCIQELSIPRRVVEDGAIAFEIHGFSDASKAAYGACVYLRCLKSNGSASMYLLSSKTRVAPLPRKPDSKKKMKPFTIPRGELCGALLLARLVTAVVNYMEMDLKEVVLWCDSQIVLCWLAKSPSSLEVFVGTRVREIQQLTQKFEWRYIESENNPADIASRGIPATRLQNADIWWHGPSTLHGEYVYNPTIYETFTEEELELRNDTVTCSFVSTRQKCELLTRYSDFRKLQRIWAYVFRFVNNCRRQKSNRTGGRLTIRELRCATAKIVAQVQREELSDEIRMLESNQVEASKLLQLAPFLDKDGLLRVGGRLKNAKRSFGHKHQLLLPSNHHVTKILIAALHKEHLHVGQHGLLAIVRQRFWPIKGKNVVRQIVKKCVRCFRLNPPEVIQYMGDLPDCRVIPSPAFTKTGLDYAGPFYIRQGIRKATKLKSYVCVFICMSTKAIHLELVSELTTQAFLAALQRFIARRGIPDKLFSDNATNFRGASSELKELYELFQSQRTTDAINELCVAREIEWSFIPPRSPNFGGIWEAGVKAAKSHMKKVLGDASLSYEEMNTVLVQIEGVLNSRPLTQLSEDPNDISALTPAHFLVGRELTAVPEPSYSGTKVSSLSRWQHLQKQKQDFWNRWSTEYLNQLQPRGKWYKNKVSIKTGMLVVIREDNMAPLQWRLGRIIQTHPGADGLVRVVTIKTSNGEVKRSVSKIAILPVDENLPAESSIDTACQRGENVTDKSP